MKYMDISLYTEQIKETPISNREGMKMIGLMWIHDVKRFCRDHSLKFELDSIASRTLTDKEMEATRLRLGIK